MNLRESKETDNETNPDTKNIIKFIYCVINLFYGNSLYKEHTTLQCFKV